MSPRAISRCSKATIIKLRTQSKNHLSHICVINFLQVLSLLCCNHSAIWRYDSHFHFENAILVDLRRSDGHQEIQLKVEG